MSSCGQGIEYISSKENNIRLLLEILYSEVNRFINIGNGYITHA